jgi:4-amino-4-deoxy-L-arabinose transferase-like glycosyltransferase
MPWLPQATRSLIVVPRSRVQRGQFDAARVLWTWCIFVLVFFSCSDSKLIPYILPAIPALALLCAGRPGGDSRGVLLAGAFLSLASGAGVLAYANGAWSSPEAVQLLRLIRPMLLCMSALLALGALLAARFALRGRPLAALAALSGAWFLGSACILVAANAAQSLYSAKDMALAVRQAAATAEPADARPGADIPPGVRVFAVQAYQQSLVFYLQRPVVLVDYRDEFDLGLTLDPQRGIATLQQFTEVWRPLTQGFAVLPPRSRERLSRLELPMREVGRFPDRVVISRR